MLASDNFDRPNENLNGSTTNSYKGGSALTWSAITGTANIVDKHAFGMAAVHVVDVSTADVDIMTVGRKDDLTPGIGHAVRVTDFNNLWLTCYLHWQGDEVQIWRRQAGSWTRVADAPFPHVVNVDYEMRTIVDGENISCEVDGVQVVSYSGASFNSSETKHGLYWESGGTGAKFDNFRIRTVTEAVLSSSSSSSTRSSSTLSSSSLSSLSSLSSKTPSSLSSLSTLSSLSSSSVSSSSVSSLSSSST